MTWKLMVLTLGLVLVLAGCQTSEGKTVRVTMNEWSLKPGVASVPKGNVTFEVVNEGKEGHYVLVCNIAGHYRLGMASAFEVK